MRYPAEGDEAYAERSLELVLEQAWGDGVRPWLSCTAGLVGFGSMSLSPF